MTDPTEAVASTTTEKVPASSSEDRHPGRETEGPRNPECTRGELCDQGRGWAASSACRHAPGHGTGQGMWSGECCPCSCHQADLVGPPATPERLQAAAREAVSVADLRLRASQDDCARLRARVAELEGQQGRVQELESEVGALRAELAKLDRWLIGDRRHARVADEMIAVAEGYRSATWKFAEMFLEEGEEQPHPDEWWGDVHEALTRAKALLASQTPKLLDDTESEVKGAQVSPPAAAGPSGTPPAGEDLDPQRLRIRVTASAGPRGLSYEDVQGVAREAAMLARDEAKREARLHELEEACTELAELLHHRRELEDLREREDVLADQVEASDHRERALLERHREIPF